MVLRRCGESLRHRVHRPNHVGAGVTQDCFQLKSDKNFVFRNQDASAMQAVSGIVTTKHLHVLC